MRIPSQQLWHLLRRRSTLSETLCVDGGSMFASREFLVESADV